MNLYCDQYSECNGYLLDQGSDQDTKTRARAKGWHIFRGTDMGGKEHNATLCDRCVDVKRRKLNPAPPLQDGQTTLFEVMVFHD